MYSRYFIKDHLGNVRMVLTDEQKTNYYPTLSAEGAGGSTEVNNQNAIWDDKNGNSIDVVNRRATRPGNFGDNSSNGSYAFSITKTGGAIGAGKLLKVMSGDNIATSIDYFYHDNYADNSNANGLNSILSNLVTALSAGNSAASGVLKADASAAMTNLNSNSQFTNVYNPQNTGSYSVQPKAYLHVLLFDEQFKFDAANSSVTQVSAWTAESRQTLYAGANVKKNGYAYIYFSNESNSLVFFDNFNLTHVASPLIEETHYYPFGLTMSGISSRAANTLVNKRKWNKGSELQNEEFSDGSGLELYATPLRSLDPQIGRWWQIDSKPDYSQSLYASMGNNPILYNDPLGDTLRVSFRTGFLGLGKRQEVIYDKGKLTNKDGSAYAGKVKGYLGKVVNALESLTYNSKEGNSMVRELEGSKNNFTIKNGSSNSFSASNQTASFGNIPSLQNVSNGTLPTGGSGGTIFWNPGISTSGMNTAGNTDRPAFIGLGHEMAHARDANKGTLYIGSDYTNPLNGNSYLAQHLGLNKSEWRAVYFENIIRGQAGIPLRSQYGLQDNGGSFTGTGPALLTPTGLPINFPIQ